MKTVTLDVVEKRPPDVEAAVYNAAKKLGSLFDVNYATAIENVKLSQGIYIIRPEKEEVGPLSQEPIPVAEMSKAMLLATGISLGMVFGTKPVKIEDLRPAVQKRYDRFMANDSEGDEGLPQE